MSRPCSYVLVAQHPLDRVLTVYSICQRNASSALCRFNRLNVQNMTLRQFVRAQGSALFRKLLYYSKHCRLVGDDEVCLPDTKTSFVLTSKERKVYLKNVLENLEAWFSVVGLEERFNVSLRLLEHVFALNYTGCGTPRKLQQLAQLDPHLWRPLAGSISFERLQGLTNMSSLGNASHVTYSAVRDKLLTDPVVLKALSADLAIYAKLEQIFKKQLSAFDVIETVIRALNSSATSVAEEELTTTGNVKPGLQGFVTSSRRRHGNDAQRSARTRGAGGEGGDSAEETAEQTELKWLTTTQTEQNLVLNPETDPERTETKHRPPRGRRRQRRWKRGIPVP